jgi:hypothetical protein
MTSRYLVRFKRKFEDVGGGSIVDDAVAHFDYRGQAEAFVRVMDGRSLRDALSGVAYTASAFEIVDTFIPQR